MHATGAPASIRLAQHGVSSARHPGPAGGAERHQGGRAQSQFLLGPGKELDVLGVGTRPSPLDVGDPEVVQLLGHPQLVVHGEREALLLAAVTQRGVEDVDRLRQVGRP